MHLLQIVGEGLLNTQSTDNKITIIGILLATIVILIYLLRWVGKTYILQHTKNQDDEISQLKQELADVRGQRVAELKECSEGKTKMIIRQIDSTSKVTNALGVIQDLIKK